MKKEFSNNLKIKKDVKPARKIWHISFGLFVALGYQYFLTKTQVLLFLFANSAAHLFGEIIRRRSPELYQNTAKKLHWILKDSEKTKIHSGVFFVASSILSILIFPKPIAILSILYLALGDPAASFFGTLWGKKSMGILRGKSFVGTLASFLVCCLITSVFLDNFIPLPRLLLFSFIGGSAASIAEVLPFKIDDNFLIPLISGFVLWGSAILLNIPT